MRVAIALDGLLCDTESLKTEWIRLNGDSKFLAKEPFWVALKPYEDVNLLASWVQGGDFYVFTERPKSLSLVTRTWLKNKCGIVVPKERLIMRTIKRYDCRINEVDALIDSDPGVIENLKTETIRPIEGYLLDRTAGKTMADILKELDESICL